MSEYVTDDGPREQYFTPPPATRALLRRIAVPPGPVAEPCAGDGWIVRELERMGCGVVSGDIDHEVDVFRPGLDFFSTRAGMAYDTCGCIITNPPWSDAARFVRRALEITPHVAMLLRLTFLEPCESTPKSARVDLLKKLSRCIVLPRISFYRGKSGTDSVCPAWFVWGFGGQEGPATVEIVTDGELAECAGQQSLFSKAEERR